MSRLLQILILGLSLCSCSPAYADRPVNPGPANGTLSNYRSIQHGDITLVMSCGDWSSMVAASQQLGPVRYKIVLRNRLLSERQGRKRYIEIFANDATTFVLRHEFQNPEQARVSALFNCRAVI